jgi:hypothetical protein
MKTDVYLSFILTLVFFFLAMPFNYLTIYLLFLLQLGHHSVAENPSDKDPCDALIDQIKYLFSDEVGSLYRNIL